MGAVHGMKGPKWVTDLFFLHFAGARKATLCGRTRVLYKWGIVSVVSRGFRGLTA
jgi:hypothetical protein